MMKRDDADYDGYNPSNAKAAAIIARSKELAKKIKKSEGSSELTLNDLLSILSAKSNRSLEDIAKMDMYQIRDSIRRYKSVDDYEVGIEALIAGAKPDDIKLEHWIHPMNPDE